MNTTSTATIEQMLAWAQKQVETKPEAVYCRCCGQELTDPKSVAAGIGPICVEKEGELE